MCVFVRVNVCRCVCGCLGNLACVRGDAFLNDLNFCPQEKTTLPALVLRSFGEDVEIFRTISLTAFMYHPRKAFFFFHTNHTQIQPSDWTVTPP